MNSFVSTLRNVVLPMPEVIRLEALRRSTTLFSQDQIADSLYFIEQGLVKVTRTNRKGSKIILTIRGAGNVLGEESLSNAEQSYYGEAEVLTGSTVYRVPREVQAKALMTNPEWAAALVSYMVHRRFALAEKVELLCLHDVEYRILHYLAELSTLVAAPMNGEGYQVPITQLELADLIGATRETTSTTLNQLERRGLVRLSRRMLTIESPKQLRAAAVERDGMDKSAAPGTSAMEPQASSMQN